MQLINTIFTRSAPPISCSPGDSDSRSAFELSVPVGDSCIDDGLSFIDDDSCWLMASATAAAAAAADAAAAVDVDGGWLELTELDELWWL